ncbi:ABC transporter permease subunit [Cognatishimia sp.]|uniref:ABC transporter permease subunit n=1 Tax=Cognatishimia sp. TaxID=2211648 RepID=UPI0035126E3B
MSCFETLQDYGLRAIGIGERLLPKTDFTFCEHVVLIGSGMIWNLYFALFALLLGFFLAIGLATARASDKGWLRIPAQSFIFVIRGSPLFIQFFIAYETFVLIPKLGYDLNLGFIEITVETRWLTKAWLGALIVLFLNTSAYTAQIFYGALQAIPRGDIEAADAIGMSPRTKFRRIVFPSMLRLAWESYTNEAIFLFHATALVFFASFPAWRQKGDALYYANYFADKTFNPFVPYPIIAAYFIFFTLVLILVFSMVGRRLNKHVR